MPAAASPFASPLFLALSQKYDVTDFYGGLFQSAKPKIIAENPYLHGNEAGIQLALKKRTSQVTAIFLFADRVEDCAQYQGALPGGLTFAHTRADVRALLGKPAMGMDASGEGIMAIAYDFDRYESDTHYMRIEYFPSGSIRMVTLGT